MKRKSLAPPKTTKPPALKRAARNAVELARRTGTPAYVLINGRIVDIAKAKYRSKKPTGRG